MEKIYHALVQAEFDRSDTLLALGGGVIGDMTGFAAATYMRGIRFIQAPTTLLAMVDASVGGKTGIDLVEGKNLVGCFKQPAAVFIDPGVLRTLPIEELCSGMAELIKHGIIADESLFNLLKQLNGDYPVLWEKQIGAQLIRLSLLVKTAIVEKDPFERNIRAVLNLGHTTGHALETISNYRLKHGEGVGIGMMVACEVARRKNLIAIEEINKVEELLNIWGIPTTIPEGTKVEKILKTMTHDKKKAGKKIKWVLPARIGQVVLDDQVDEGLLKDALIQAGAMKS
jgi:3-dehydroquinate synthase